MSLFQRSVLNKYLKEQDEQAVADAFVKFKAYFNNPVIQQNIRESKEEQYQEGFLRELFVKIFGYVINPNPDYNLTTEFKNLVGSKKADGAILKDGKAIGVIELKSTKTKDLESIRQQAFDYKAHHTSCTYVVTSNFEKLRFYINDAVEFEEFDLFMLSKERFQLLYLCLNSNNLFSDLPLQIKNASILEEEQITRKFYNDYSLFKKELFEDIASRNIGLQDVSKLLLYKKTQKLLDRFLFIFFAEDRGLLPPNSISRMIRRWNTLKDEDAYKPLYEIFNQYFGYLNKGRKGKVPADDIHEYNGGLFLPDVLLDQLAIDDAVLLKHTSILTNYDFESQVDVNILGHIFEHSLNEIESTTAELEGVDFDQQKSKRKKDGVYYTPKYITKYIVDNTVGKLCEEKKAELGMVDEDYMPNRQKDTKKKLLARLETYRNWLLELTICDPACGSGAFLNQALEFLIKEHHYVDELHAKLFDSPMVFQDVENQILERNLFGVDINEESVDIARLSLWLRTAQRGRKLTTLNKNIKCGNSLIDDPEVAGDKAFNWSKEFPEVFARSGFDVVIGNPPYIHLEKIKETSIALKNANYTTYHSQGDMYCIFVEKGMQILKPKGVISYIMSNKWLQAGYGKPLREFFLKYQMDELIDFGDIQIFEGATTYPCIFTSRKNQPQKEISISALKDSNLLDFKSSVMETAEMFEADSLSGETWVISSQNEQLLLERLKTKLPTLSDFIGGQSYRGVLTGLTEAFLIDGKTKRTIIENDPKAEELIKPVLQGRDIKPWISLQNNTFLIGTFPALKLDIENYLSIKDYFINFGKERLDQSGKKGSRKKTNNKWFETQDTIGYYKEFGKPKIMYQAFQVKPCFIYDDQGLFSNNSIWFIPSKNKALLGVLNSKMGWWLITKYCTQIQNGYQLIWKYFGQIPVPEISKSPQLTTLVNEIISKTAELQKNERTFISLVKNKFEIEKPSKKLQHWPELEFSEFLKELKKAKVQLSLSEAAEWMAYFNEQKQKALELKSEINRIDHEIDQMVYELYGLTEEEIRIVEEG
jgi:type I restriction-modification system DNA methylase subunit